MHHPIRRRQVIAGSFASLLVPSLARADEARVAPAVAAVVPPLMARHDIPGMSIGVTVDGSRHLFQYGVAARDGGAPVTADTLFEIGSLSKTFTATLAAYAQALGKLSLADTPGRFLPALRGSAVDAATLLHLGTYTAGGLPLQFPEDVKDLAGAMAFYRAWKPDARPGEQRRYSNPSIGLMGHVAAVAMQRDFAEVMEQELFPHLGLRQTFIRVPASQQPAYAWGHDKANRAIRVNPGVFDAQAYGVRTTASDLLRFVEANIDAASLQPALRGAIAETHVPRFRIGPMVQGLGWEQYPYPSSLDRLQAGNADTMALDAHPAQALAVSAPGAQGATLFNKTGSTNGFGGYAAFVPARRLGIVLLANRNYPNAARIAAASAILDQVEATRR
jgi:beta-lactamase class C